MFGSTAPVCGTTIGGGGGSAPRRGTAIGLIGCTCWRVPRGDWYFGGSQGSGRMMVVRSSPDCACAGAMSAQASNRTNSDRMKLT